MKICSVCDKQLSLERFAMQKTGKMGRRADCKSCVKRFRRSPVGLVNSMLSAQKAVSKKRGYKQPEYTKEELYEWVVTNKDFNKLYSAWVSSGHNKLLRPSCDRLNDYSSYRLDNIRLVTTERNTSRYNRDVVSGQNTKVCKAIDMLSLDGVMIKRYHSVAEAIRKKKLPRGAVIKCCVAGDMGEPVGGYMWRYSSINNFRKEE